jgi:hypothetical protein
MMVKVVYLCKRIEKHEERVHERFVGEAMGLELVDFRKNEENYVHGVVDQNPGMSKLPFWLKGMLGHKEFASEEAEEGIANT